MSLASEERAEKSRRFFKTKPGEYGAHDKFLGVSNPDLRKLVKKYPSLPLTECTKLLRSSYNEERLLALFIMVNMYQKGDQKTKEKVYSHYVGRLRYVDNWNLVDASAYQIMGAHIVNKSTAMIDALSKQNDLWFRRVAIVATLAFIKAGQFEPTVNIAKRYFNDKEDLIHKATGWMLREVGKQNEFQLLCFLENNAHKMPRTMLRYAIERLPPHQRLEFLHQKG